MSPGQASKAAISLLIAGVLVVVTIVAVTNAATVSGSVAINASETPTADIDSRLSDIPENVGVSATTENAIYLTQGSSVDASVGDDNLTTGNWSLAATAALNTSHPNATDVSRTVLNHDNSSAVVAYNDSGSWEAYYDNGSANASVSVADGGPDDFTPVVARYNGSHLVLTANGTTDSAAMTTAPSSLPLAYDWIGRIDEVRSFNGSINDSAVSTYQNDPIEPLEDEPREIRYMFDRGEGTTAQAYFSDEDATLDSVQWVDGVDAPSLQQDGTLVANPDYRIVSDVFGIEIVDGGYLEGAPVVYVTYNGGAFIPLNAPSVFGLLLFVTLLGWAGLKVKNSVSAV